MYSGAIYIKYCITTTFTEVNPLKSYGNYMYHPLYELVTLSFAFTDFVQLSEWTAIMSLNSVNQLIFVMVTCDVFFAVRTEFLNII
jgi:hypothetical protein